MKSKQIFASAAAALLLMSGAVFAQELKFDVYLNSGLGIIANNNKDVDPNVKAFGVDSESNAYRFRLNGSFANEAKNAGAKFRIQSQRDLSKSGYFSLPYAYGWVGFFNNALSVFGGIVNEGTWQTGDFWLASEAVGDGLGGLLKATPIKGLDFGLGAYVLNLQSGGNNNMLNIGGSLPNFANAAVKAGDVKYTYHASYTMADTFRLAASFRWKNKAGGNGTNISGGYKYDGTDESSRLIGEFRFLGIKDLSAVAAASFDRIEDFTNNGNIIISETLGYKIKDLGFGLNAVQFLYNRTGAANSKIDYNPGLLFNLWGTYAIDKIIPRLDIVYFQGGQSKMATSARQWERKGFVNNAQAKNAGADFSVFSARPSVKINLDSKTFIEIGDIINYDSSEKSGAYADSGDAGKKSLISNVFYVDIKWSF